MGGLGAESKVGMYCLPLFFVMKRLLLWALGGSPKAFTAHSFCFRGREELLSLAD